MRAFKLLVACLTASSLLIVPGCKKNTGNTLTSLGLPMTGDQEVPARKTPAVGVANVTYNKQTKILNFDLTWVGLTGIPILAHIHGPARPGQSAPPKYDFSDRLPKSTAATFSDWVHLDDTDIIEDSLVAGLYYFNIHTPIYPGGEIRGQIVFK
jgi:hypothetical protein